MNIKLILTTFILTLPLTANTETVEGMVAHNLNSSYWSSYELIISDGTRIYRASTSRNDKSSEGVVFIQSLYISFPAVKCDGYYIKTATKIKGLSGNLISYDKESSYSRTGLVQVDDKEPIGFYTESNTYENDTNLWVNLIIGKPVLFLKQISNGKILRIMYEGAGGPVEYILNGESIKRAYQLCKADI